MSLVEDFIYSRLVESDVEDISHLLPKPETPDDYRQVIADMRLAAKRPTNFKTQKDVDDWYGHVGRTHARFHHYITKPQMKGPEHVPFALHRALVDERGLHDGAPDEEFRDIEAGGQEGTRDILKHQASAEISHSLARKFPDQFGMFSPTERNTKIDSVPASNETGRSSPLHAVRNFLRRRRGYKL